MHAITPYIDRHRMDGEIDTAVNVIIIVIQLRWVDRRRFGVTDVSSPCKHNNVLVWLRTVLAPVRAGFATVKSCCFGYARSFSKLAMLYA